VRAVGQPLLREVSGPMPRLDLSAILPAMLAESERNTREVILHAHKITRGHPEWSDAEALDDLITDLSVYEYRRCVLCGGLLSLHRSVPRGDHIGRTCDDNCTGVVGACPCGKPQKAVFG
jgi:hypothetical protein